MHYTHKEIILQTTYKGVQFEPMARGGGEFMLKPLSEDVDNLDISSSNSENEMDDPMMDLE